MLIQNKNKKTPTQNTGWKFIIGCIGDVPWFVLTRNKPPLYIFNFFWLLESTQQILNCIQPIYMWFLGTISFYFHWVCILVISLIVVINLVCSNFFFTCYQIFELRKLLPTSLPYDFNIHVSFNQFVWRHSRFSWSCHSFQ